MKTVFKFVLIICALAGNPVFADSITWFVNGLDNSPVATMNESGHLLAKESYNPYGKKRLNHSLNRDEIGYTGHQHDHVTGLTYAQQRYYHPDIGFYSVDPIPWTLVNPVHSFNRYVYANNNPFRYNDPDGQFGNFVVKGLVDLGLNIAINLATTGKVGFVSAVKETISSAVDPTKTVKKVKRLRKLVGVTKRPRTKKVEPIKEAEGSHTTWKKDPQTGKITRHETWRPNPKNPSGFDKVQSTDVKGAPHVNKKTGEAVPTPHTQGKNIPGGVRPATPDEIPK